MSLSMHTLRPAKGAKRTVKRVGRGNATGKGTTAGRGGKGQTARSGGRNRLKLLGMRHMMLQAPKLRGFKSHHAKPASINVGQLNYAFQNGEMVSPKTLAKKHLTTGTGRVKILAAGNLKKKLIIVGCEVSEQAKEKVAAAGGEVRVKNAPKA